MVHAAVHLDDGLIANLTESRLQKVLQTKIDGITISTRRPAASRLNSFVAYSSATTMVGSPGQAAYVAANAFLEGFMRRRRHLGKPGLAVGWGAIADVGIIARDKDLGHGSADDGRRADPLSRKPWRIWDGSSASATRSSLCST